MRGFSDTVSGGLKSALNLLIRSTLGSPASLLSEGLEVLGISIWLHRRWRQTREEQIPLSERVKNLRFCGMLPLPQVGESLPRT